jgi:hypothetical protein
MRNVKTSVQLGQFSKIKNRRTFNAAVFQGIEIGLFKRWTISFSTTGIG